MYIVTGLPGLYNIYRYEQKSYSMAYEATFMRATLVFTPCASPTYMPLGLESLSAYIKTNHPNCLLNVMDLNIAAWNRLIDNNKQYHDFRNFMQGRLNDFYDETQYKLHQLTWKQLSDIQEDYTLKARLYLEQNIIDSEFGQLLDYYSGLVLANDPELIGFSVMYPRQILISLAFAKFMDFQFSRQIISVKASSRPQIIFGGAMMSALYSEEILTVCHFVDAIFEGEGEVGLGMLCEKRDFSEIPGLVFRGPAGITRNRKADTISLARTPLPDFSELNFSSYLNPEPVVPVIFSRGCKWRKCRFCAHNFSYSGYRRRDPVRFVEYLKQLNIRTGARHFYFSDQYIDADDMKLLAEEILHRELNIYFHIMGRPTDDYTFEVFELLFRAGCRWISWGIENGSQRVLDVCRKGTSVDTIRKIIPDAHRAGISNLLMMIFGLPTATEEDFDATSRMLEDMDDSIDAVTNSCFQLFDKTGFASQAAKFGLKIIGREKLFSNEHGAAHSHRLIFRETALDGTTRPPRGQLELNRLLRRRLWNSQHPILQNIACEHYLLYATHQKQSDSTNPITESDPPIALSG
jgi:anaerobic magnesium-protoporphyrin IX monomethyl ester cyclase